MHAVQKNVEKVQIEGIVELSHYINGSGNWQMISLTGWHREDLNLIL